MTPFKYRRSLLAFAVAASSAAYGQSPCDQDIRQIEQEITRQQLNQQKQMEVRDLLRAARQGSGDCNTYVARARELMNQGTQTDPASTAQRSTATAPTTVQRAQPPVQEPSETARTSQQPVQPVTPQQPSDVQQPIRPEQRVAEQPSARQAEEPDRTMEVQVDQAPAEVDVKTQSPQIVVKQQPAEVTVEQKPPKIEITQREPKIEVEQPKPEVKVNRAQPDVEVTQSEPQVEVKQSDPNVRVVQPEATARVETEQPGQQSAMQQQSQISLADLQGQQALSSQGEEIGEVQEFVRSTRDGTAHALIAVGGVLGVGERTIAVPLDRLSLTQEGKLQTQLSQEEIEQQEEYDEQQFTEVQQSEFAALEAELESAQ